MQMRSEQLHTLQSTLDAQFVEKVMAHMRERHPGVTDGLSDEVLRQRIKVSLAKGCAYGFTWQSSLVAFVILMFEVAPNFDNHPAFRTALENSRAIADENARIQSIYRSVTDQDWESGQKAYDEKAWAGGQE